MAAPGTIPPLETSAALRRRSPALLLPEEPSREELAQFWTLSDRDRAEVMRCQGEANQRRFAVQLCALRAYGRFLPKAVAAPVAITNHLARQLDLPPVLFGQTWPRPPLHEWGIAPTRLHLSSGCHLPRAMMLKYLRYQTRTWAMMLGIFPISGLEGMAEAPPTQPCPLPQPHRREP
jgi:Domain of unknown function (DUF4158)